MLRRLAVLGCLGTVVPILLVVAGLLAAGDVAARRYATGQLSDRIRAAVPEASGVHARIRSFPFVGRIVFNRPLSDVGARIDSVTVSRGVSFSHLDVDLRDVVIDGSAIWNEQSLRLRRVRRGTVSVQVTEQALGAALGRTTHITGGHVDVEVLPASIVAGSVSITPDRQLSVRVGLLPAFQVPLPSIKLLPCLPAVAVGAGELTLACTFTSVPPAFVEAVSTTTTTSLP